MSARDRAGDGAQYAGTQVNTEPRPMMPGLELRGKHPVGRDPREMTPDELKEAGHEPMSPLQAIRAHCLDCRVYQEKEVALCTAVKCPSWLYRMGTDPWQKPASQTRREAARRTMTNLNARRQKGGGAEPSAGPSDHGTALSPAEGSGVGATWATARRDRVGETERHRSNGGNSDSADQFPEGAISNGEQGVTGLGEIPEGRAA
jgi:hypothetical protein